MSLSSSMNHGRSFHNSMAQQKVRCVDSIVAEEHQFATQDAQPDLRSLMAQHALPNVHSVAKDLESMSSSKATSAARTALEQFNLALNANSAEELKTCFFPEQAFWKDQLALTWHLRTFISPAQVAKNLMETKSLREMTGNFEITGEAKFVQAGPSLKFIVCPLAFKTGSPAATCSGMMWLLPVERQASDDGTSNLTWKIWILSTKLEKLDEHLEDESLLGCAGKCSKGLAEIKTDVFIVGAGNAAVALAARLKALGVHSVMVDRNSSVGDNWALRYDCMKFHIPTSFCELPYLRYSDELQGQMLTRNDLATHVKNYAQTFNLDIIHSVEIIQTTRRDDGQWQIKFRTADKREVTATARHLVQATGIGSQKPYVPSITEREAYKGTSLHSSEFKNATELKYQGIKTVCIVGSANTAFDVLEDCHAAGLQATMISRSPTYIVPLEYVCDKYSLGAYDFGVEAADNLFMMLPTIVDAQLGRGLFAQLASQEPDRYSALINLGFPVLDSRDPSVALMHNLIERGGGHYVDTGATALLTQKEVDFVAGVEPKGYTPTGLRLSDGKTLEADAVLWCTGFSDKDIRQTVYDILKISLPVDATWGVNEEGDIRGMWRRHSRVSNFWVMGGYTQQHRWFSKLLALQIKAELEGILPAAYGMDLPTHEFGT